MCARAAGLAAAGFLAGAWIASGADAGPGSGGKSSGGPAAVSNPRPETELTTVTLTQEAEKRIGIELSAVDLKVVRRERVLGGEVVLPLGGEGDSIYDLFPTMTPAEFVRLAGLQAEAASRFEQAQLRADAAETAFARAEELAGQGAASQRAMEEARAGLAIAKSELAGAKAQRDLLGAPVFESAKSKSLWVRVPVYTGDTDRLDGGAVVQIGGLADRPGKPAVEGKRVNLPLAATGGAVTVDWYYAFERPEAEPFFPGQKVGVRVPLKGIGAKSKVVPWSAVVYDIHGGSWVYVKSAAQSYRRERVLVRAVAGGEVSLDAGPAEGTEVVAVGAAELFGTEFGVGK